MAICINTDCGFNDWTSETGCAADLSTWEDCQDIEVDEDEMEIIEQEYLPNLPY